MEIMLSALILFLFIYQTTVLSLPDLKNELSQVDIKERKLLVKFVKNFVKAFNTTVVLRSSVKNSTIYETSKFVHPYYIPTISQWFGRDAHKDFNTYDRDLFGHDRREIVDLKRNNTYLVLLKDFLNWDWPYFMQLQLACHGRRDTRDLNLFVSKSEIDWYVRFFVGLNIQKYVSSLQYVKSENQFVIFYYTLLPKNIPYAERKKLVYSNYSESTSDLDMNSVFLDKSGNMHKAPVFFDVNDRYLIKMFEDYLNASMCLSNIQNCNPLGIVYMNDDGHDRLYYDCSEVFKIHLNFYDRLGMLLPLPKTYYGTYSQYTSVFTPLLWVLIGFTYKVIFLVLKYVFKVNMTFIEMVFEFTYRPIIQYAINISQYVSSDRAKSLLLLTTALSILLTNGFTSVMTSLMVVPEEEDQPNTLEKLAKCRKCKFASYFEKDRLFRLLNINKTNISTVSRLLERGKYNVSIIDIVPMTLNRTVVVGNTMLLNFLSNVEVNQNGAPLLRLHTLDSPLRPYFILVTLESPFREKFALYLSRTKSAGNLMYKQIEDDIEVIKKRKITEMQRLIVESKKNPLLVKALNLEIMTPCFVIFFCLIGACIIVLILQFSIELVTKILETNRSRITPMRTAMLPAVISSNSRSGDSKTSPGNPK